MTDDAPRASLSPPHSAGIAAAVITFMLLVSALAWLSHDPRFVGSLQLASAMRIVLADACTVSTPQEVLQSAADGLTSVLDPFSEFMPPEEYGWFTEETQGEYVGIGVEIKITRGVIVITHVFPHTAADEAMLRAGDRIVAIAGMATAGFTLARTLEVMRGPTGTRVTLRVRSPGGDEHDVSLERRSVALWPFPIVGETQFGVAYVRWSDFSAGSGDSLGDLVADLMSEESSGLILDLRGNPGGLLDEAVSGAGVFLPSGSLVCTLADRTGRNREEYRTGSDPPVYDGPVVLILDETSASSSEVFAAALQEAGRAVIVGRRSFGKGWVQNIFPCGDAGALRLSTGRYFTPDGHAVGDPATAARLVSGDTSLEWQSGAGIEPDLPVEHAEVGPWQRLLSNQAVFADFAAAYDDDWPATGPEDADELLLALRSWCDSLDIGPPPLPPIAFAEQQAGADTGRGDTLRSLPDSLLQSLDRAHTKDADLLYAREHDQLLVRLWEQRILRSADRPDPGELDALLDADRDLVAARDLLEEPDRYEALISKHRHGHAPSGGT